MSRWDRCLPAAYEQRELLVHADALGFAPDAHDVCERAVRTRRNLRVVMGNVLLQRKISALFRATKGLS